MSVVYNSQLSASDQRLLTTTNQTQLVNQTLDPSLAKLHDVVLRHNKDKFDRLVPITASDDKGYYFMTEFLEPQSVFCSTNEIIDKNGKKCYKHGFTLRTPKPRVNSSQYDKSIGDTTTNTDNTLDNESDNKSDIESDVESKIESFENEGDIQNNIHTEKTNKIENLESTNKIENLESTNKIENLESSIIIDRLNKLQRGITDRIQYMMMIPHYECKKSFNLGINTIKINNTIKYKNIIEYQNKRNNFYFDIVKQVLIKCRCKLLLKVNYLMITNTNVILNIRLVRIYPDNLDNISMSNKIHINNELNYVSSKNAEKYNELNDVPKFTKVSKADAKNNLMKLFNITTQPSIHNKQKFKNMRY